MDDIQVGIISRSLMTLNNLWIGAEETAQPLGVLAALPEDLALIPSPHMMALWIPGIYGVYIHTFRQNNYKFKIKNEQIL